MVHEALSDYPSHVEPLQVRVMKVNMLEAKSQLSKLVKAAVEGEDVVIANNGKPVVRLVRIVHAEKRRKPGAWRKPLPRR